MSEIRIITKDELKEQSFFSDKVRAVTHTFDKKPLAFVHSYGCQQNVSDGEKIKGMLEKMGYGFTDDTKQADFILFNTCAVRENAEERVFGNIGALKHLKAKNPKLVIAVCGCMVQQEHITKRIKSSFPFVDLVFGTHNLHEFPRLLYLVFSGSERVIETPSCDGVICEGLPLRRDSDFRASVPIMYGCNNFCTYCIVPYVRGRERSRAWTEIYSEVKGLVENGYKEITLLGQNVNSYAKGDEVDFPELLRRLDKIDGEYIISFMTSHPKDCTKELIDVISQSIHISHHLHLPVQSGSDRILTLMNRHYDRQRYISLVKYAREKIPDINLSTDIIVGFPGELRDDFEQTLSLMREIRYDSAFTFIYSKRSGTKAAQMEDPVSDEEKSAWFKELLEVQSECGGHTLDKYVGRRMRVLCEGEGRTDKSLMTGKTRQNIIVDFEGTPDDKGKFLEIEITEALSWALVGKKASE